MTTAETAKAVGLHPHTLTRFARENIVPGEYIGGPRGWAFSEEKVREALRRYWANSAEKRGVILNFRPGENRGDRAEPTNPKPGATKGKR